ncbi:helix-turn-helix domain-containing protein [Streptomyces anulatus]|uniref:helix-turn-helix domain-containing protein n=1 Tax=Streptomyces anulatus TaxID=1892 RepID=UPI002F90E342
MDTSTEVPEWLTVGEVAQHYRVSARTVSRWAASGEIRSKRVGPGARLIRIHRSAVDAEQPNISAVA